MKKLIKCLVIMMMLTMVVLVATETDTYAATKKAKVTYTLKKGTLTIKGKGKMPKKMKFKNDVEIEKVVIKKGVTSISDSAFRGCHNLKTVKLANTVKEIGRSSFQGTAIKSITIPASVKKIGNHAFLKCNKLTTITMPGDFKVTKVKKGIEESVIVMSGKKIKTINFNTNFNYESAAYIKGSQWNVRKKDPNYKSIDGIIYTKDGKDLVRVPKNRKELKIADGCETFCLQSIYYYEIWDSSEDYCPCEESLEKIIIPSTVKKIENKKYITRDAHYKFSKLTDIVIESKQLDRESISLFVNQFDYMIENIVQELPDRLSIKDDFCILDDTILLKYIQKEGTYYNSYTIVSVPEGIKEIASEAFLPNYMSGGIYEVVLPEGLEKIGDKAFYNCDELRSINLPESLKSIGSEAFCSTYSLTEINLPRGLESIGTKAFLYSYIKKITIPENIKKWGKNVFQESALEEVILPDNMRVIPEGMFRNATSLKNINIPKSLTTIGGSAFYRTNVDIQKFLDCETLTTIKVNAFRDVEWEELVIPEHIQSVAAGALKYYYGKSRKVTIEGYVEGISDDAFPADAGWYSEDITFIFEKDSQKTYIELNKKFFTSNKKKKLTKIGLSWEKAENMNGYDIRIYSDKKCKKLIKKITVKKNKASTNVKISKYYKKVYVKIRPYRLLHDTIKNTGKWSEAKKIS